MNENQVANTKALNNYSRKHCTGVVIYVDDSQI